MVARHGGEIPFEALDSFFKSALPYYRENGLLDETPVRFDLERYRAAPTPLSFPGKVLADEASDRLFIADSNHNRIVITRLDGTLIETIGLGAIGAADGDFASATFNHPQGMALLGEALYVADTENHLLRKIDLAQKQVATLAGTGTGNVVVGITYPSLEDFAKDSGKLGDDENGQKIFAELDQIRTVVSSSLFVSP